MNSLFWHKLKSKGDLPTPREGLSFIHSPRLNKWIIFGGTGEKLSSEVFSYDPQSKTFEAITTKGHSPRPRAHHCAWIDEIHNVMFVHAGQGDKRDSLGDIYALDLDNWLWKKLYIIDQPCGRTNSAICKARDKVFLYGGCSLPENLMLGDLWSFQYLDIHWGASGTEVPAPGWVMHKTTGTSPGPRKGHSIFSHGNSLFLFGGISSQKYTAELFTLDLEKMKWQKAQTKGRGPSPRAFHSLAIIDTVNVAIFGGVESLKEGRAERMNILNDFYILDMLEMHWSCPVIGGYWPSRRYGHAMCWGYNSEGRAELLLLGGLDINYCSPDVYSLQQTETPEGKAWTVPQKTQLEPPSKNKAESTLQDQFKKIRELQTQVSVNRDKIVVLENENANLTDTLEQEAKKIQEEENFLKKEISSLEESETLNKQQVKKLKKDIQSLESTGEKHKAKVEALEDLVKKAETLLITLDHSLNEVMTVNSQQRIKGLSNKRIQEINERRQKHYQALIKLRDTYEGYLKESQAIEEQLKAEQYSPIPEADDSLEDSLDSNV